MRTAPLSVVLTLALAAPAAVAAQSVAGEWDATISTPGGVRNVKMIFEANGEKLTGTVKRPTGDVPLTGTQKGDTVKFTYSVIYNDNPMDITISALVSGDTMKGTVDFGGMAQDEFSAKRATPPRSPPPDRRAGARAGLR